MPPGPAGRRYHFAQRHHRTRLDFAGEGKVKATVSTDRLENINDVFQRMIDGRIEGRVVLDLAS